MPTSTSVGFSQENLRNRLLSVILPTVLGTLTLSGLMGYRFLVREKAQQDLQQQLANQVTLAGKSFEQRMKEAVKVLELIANSSQTLDSVRASQVLVQRSNLESLSIEQLEQQFSETKLLQTNQKLNNELKRILQVSGFSEIFYTNSQGLNIAYSNPTSDFVQRDEDWWQKGQTENQWLNPPEFDESANTVGFELVQSIRDPQTGQFLGVIKALLPGSYFDLVVNNLALSEIEKSQAIQIITPEAEQAIQSITSRGSSDEFAIIGGEDIAEIAELLLKTGSNLESLTKQLQASYRLKELTIVPYGNNNDLPMVSFLLNNKYFTLLPIKSKNWVAIASIDRLELQAAGSEMIPVLLPVALVVGIAVTIIIIRLANKLAQPLVDLATTAERAAAGELDILAEPKGTLETQTLAYSFNNLIVQVRKLLQQQKEETFQAQTLRDIILHVNNLQDAQAISETIVEKLQSALNADRVIYYSLAENAAGIVVAESLVTGYSATLGEVIYTPEVVQELLTQAQENHIQEISDIQEVEISQSYRQQLEALAVRASLTCTIEIPGKALGFLILQQCSDTRNWQEREIDFVEQVSNQMVLVLDRLEFLKQQNNAELEAKQAKEQLEERAWQLLEEVEGLTAGDLTIRAKITDDEIGTIADSYNATIESLHRLVTQVKNVATEVEKTAATNDSLVQKLKVEAMSQADEVAETVTQIQTMTESIHNVSANAARAEKIVQQASNTISDGDRAMNQAVVKINSLQTTVLETEQKVKRLGESSQEISQVVNSIGRFAAQTHLLALKASIEAARAGEQGKGFAVIADEVRSLAGQSATATADVDNLVARIQLEMNEVMTAMAQGTQQVVTGTELVQTTRQNLSSITTASQEISQLVQEIVQAASQQSATSNLVSANIAHVAVTAQENSQSATEVSQEIAKLLAVAAKLQAGIAKFKT
ncbi:MAG: methyl-accepting chemotaxis protein [Xenococcus sp. (in: cyanobacteria)]